MQPWLLSSQYVVLSAGFHHVGGRFHDIIQLTIWYGFKGMLIMLACTSKGCNELREVASKNLRNLASKHLLIFGRYIYIL